MRKEVALITILLATASAAAQTTIPAPDTITRAEAARRGVPVQQVQLENALDQIESLRKQIADLQKTNAALAAASTDPLKRTEAIPNATKPTQVKPAKDAPAPTSQYDRFKDETSIRTSKMSLMMITEPNGEKIKDPTHPSFGWSVEIIFTAIFDGKEISGKSPRYVYATFTCPGNDIIDVAMNFLADDARLKAKVTDTLGGVGSLAIEPGTAKAIGSAKKVEGQIDRIEFVFSPTQIAEVNNFCKIVYPDK